ncbi:putative claudin-24 [Protopterus annectens]|uniref:putative claudin-24 n=1 Tax=Protopterus annectens TaxID=7888 RepID=UPI001CF9CBBE|nr:putative claudin-24 [Protopterus annectens]
METESAALELAGIFLCFAGCILSVVATLLPQWLMYSTELLVTEKYIQGLWEACVIHELGTIQCGPHGNLLELPAEIRVARILLCTSVTAGILGFLSSFLGLNSVNFFSKIFYLKGNTKAFGGILALLAGIAALVPVSYVSHVTLVKFWDPTIPEIIPRWEFGNAILCGWIGSFLFLFSSVFLFVSYYCGNLSNLGVHSHMEAEIQRNVNCCKMDCV